MNMYDEDIVVFRLGERYSLFVCNCIEMGRNNTIKSYNSVNLKIFGEGPVL